MSRSRRRLPILGLTRAVSDKWDKQISNRRWRSRSRIALKSGRELPRLREVSNIYDFAKEGKYWRRRPRDKSMRK